MASLTEPQKLFVVKALACFDSPSRVSALVREEFGIDVDRRRIQEYDPERAGPRAPGKKLRAVFEETRKQFLEAAGKPAISHSAFRLRGLQRMYLKAEEQGNLTLAAQLLEQAAKEVGGAFTNRRELTGLKGGAIQSATQTSTLTPEEFRDIAKQVADEV